MPSEEQSQVPKDMNSTTDHESEETLSLCDLPLYSDQSADWDQDFSLASKSTSSSCQEDYFEFFSQELRPSAATAAPPENIIFCGKLIPYKELEIKNQITKDGAKRRRFRWRFLSKNGGRSTTALMQQPPPPKKMYNTKKRGRVSGFTTGPSSSSSSGKARWYLFLFGVSRFSPAVELRDIRGRQSRRSCPSSAPPPSMFGFENRDDKVVGGGGWGLWWLIRALSCG